MTTRPPAGRPPSDDAALAGAEWDQRHPAEMRIHALDACPICGHAESTPVELGTSHELRRCADCSLVYASRFADADDIYVEGYLKGETAFGLDIFQPRFQDFLEFAATKRLEVIESLWPAKGSLLDVGCGAGEVLQVAQRRGWEVAGAEPVGESAEIARGRGLDVRTALLQDAGFPEGSWDVVSAFHVLEHIPDGAGFLRSLARWAKPGGLVFVEVPNWGSHDRERHGERWPGLRPLEHVAHYDTATLRRAFEEAGLEPVHVRTMGFLWDQQSLGQQLADLAHRRWAPALRPFTRRFDQGGVMVRRPLPPLRWALRRVQAAYDRRHKGQVVLGAARAPA